MIPNAQAILKPNKKLVDYCALVVFKGYFTEYTLNLVGQPTN